MFVDINYQNVPLVEETHKGHTVMLLTEIFLTKQLSCFSHILILCVALIVVF